MMALVCWSASYNAILWQIRQNQKMTSRLPILAIACCWMAASGMASAQNASPQGVSAAAPNEPADHAGITPDVLVRHVIANLEAQSSIVARLRHRIDLLGKPLVGTGIYLQQGRGVERMLRLELDVQMSKDPGKLCQVCDGKKLWLSETIGGETKLATVDVARLVRARPKSLPLDSPPLNISLGGLPKLMSDLDGAFSWGLVADSRLEDLRVWSVEGRWKPARLTQMLPDQKPQIDAGQPVNLQKLPKNVPDRVVLHIGVEDGFPYRIEYWKQAAARRDDAAREQEATRDSDKLLVLLEFYEVRLNSRIDPAQFVFDPQGKQAVDRTGEYLERLGLEEAAAPGASRPSGARR
jgi:hypothetical protein